MAASLYALCHGRNLSSLAGTEKRAMIFASGNFLLKSHLAILLETGEKLRVFLTVGREFRQQQQLKNSEPISRLIIPREIFGDNESLYAIIRKQLNCTAIEFR